MLRKLGLAATLAAVVIAALPATASAEPGYLEVNARNTSAVVPPGLTCTPAVPSIGAFGCYEPAGDKLWVYDGRADGHHVAVFFSVSDHAGVCHNYHGTAAGWTVCDQSRLADFIPEPQQIAFRAWVMEGDDVLARSDFAFDSTS